MGQQLSSESKFIADIQSELKARHIEVAKKDLCAFLCLVKEACPWFVITAPRLAGSTWRQVGRELSNFCQSKKDETHTNCIMQYWQLLQGIIVNDPFSPTSMFTVNSAQHALDSASRAHSAQHSAQSSLHSSFADLTKLFSDSRDSPPPQPSKSPPYSSKSALYPYLDLLLQPSTSTVQPSAPPAPIITMQDDSPESEPLDPGRCYS